MGVISDNKHFEQLVKTGNPIGEVIGVDHFLIKVKGLHPVNIHAVVMFENGERGYVSRIHDEYVSVLFLGKHEPTVGSVVVVQSPELTCKVGKDFIGRVVNASGEPIDGKGPIPSDADWPVFNVARPISERQALDVQLCSC